ncbi:magnesium transporter [Neorhodopirellula lusitana]|uniref:Magnesium transport protein CorA n=1 Tax=Neorhodopirellula lusitana TaxID=445327 RepID=A0ABY1PPF2_9BACT|nr:magnesium/cobalt transporter CorA [Neorhodopirellula lusitana]SMP40715.1 magnesium transporter [Neorhodopirellula lusitana]
MGKLFKRRQKVGTAPGTMPPVKQGTKASFEIRVIRYSRNTHSDRTLTTRSEVEVELKRIASGQHSSRTEVTWIDVATGNHSSTLRMLANVFGLHPLAVEDVDSEHQHVKCEKYDDTLFFMTRMAMGSSRFDTEQVSIFLQKNVVITIQEHPGDCLDSVRTRIDQARGRIRTRRADYLFYSIIDRIVDEFFPVMERYDVMLGELSSMLETGSHRELPLRLHHIRDDLLQVRKISTQYRLALKRLLIDGSDVLDEDTQYFVRDCQDHVNHLLDASDLGREYCGELRELHFALLGQKNNDISKVLTLIATVFIPMSFIAGVYGMNFDSEESSLNMPELHWAFGYPFALALMAMTGGGLLFYLHRRGWLH